MILRMKTLIIFCTTLFGLIIVLYGASHFILLNSFTELDEKNTHQNVERVLNVLSNELSSMDAIAYDWAAWDDTYVFIEDLNEEYIDSNLVDETFSGLRLNVMLFVNSSGQIVFGKAFDLQSEKEIPVPQGLKDHLSANSLLVNHSDTESNITGIILLPEGPMLIASRPILTSEDEGPIRGTLIIGRYLDSSEIDHLAEITQLNLTLTRFSDSRIDLQTTLLEETPILVQPLNEESIAGYALLKDIYGKPILVLEVDMPRDIYKQGQATMRYFILSLIAIGMVFGVVTMLLLERSVLSRLTQLSTSVSKIARSGDLSARVSIAGDDELSNLADVINGMLGALEKSQIALRESEERYRAIIETANSLIVGLDEEGKIIIFNRKCEEVTGWKREQVMGKKWVENFIPERAREEFLGVFERIKRGEFVDWINPIKTKNGERIIWWHSTTVKRNDEKIIIGIGQDITEQEMARKRVEELNESLKIINSILRHDLLNNLSIIRGVLEIFKEKKDEKFLETALKTIDKSEDLIKEMRELECLISYGEELKPYNVREVLDVITESYSVDFRVEGDCTVMADEALSSVFDNIIRNAVVHGKTNRIDIKIERKGDVCEIRIADHGVGIPDEIKYKIFEDGFKYGETGHSGLGLYIVKKTIDRYGGSIHVEDNEPKGAVFTIVMKAAKCD